MLLFPRPTLVYVASRGTRCVAHVAVCVWSWRESQRVVCDFVTSERHQS